MDWVIDFAGDGPLMSAFKAKMEELRLAERINLHGWVEQDVVHRLMWESDMLLMPSLAEGLPIVGIRALAPGLPILGSDIPGLKNLIDHGGNGYKCPVNDLDQFVARLRSMLTMAGELEEMKAQSLHVAEKFDLRMIVDQHEELFESVRLRNNRESQSINE